MSVLVVTFVDQPPQEFPFDETSTLHVSTFVASDSQRVEKTATFSEIVALAVVPETADPTPDPEPSPSPVEPDAATEPEPTPEPESDPTSAEAAPADGSADTDETPTVPEA